MEKFYKKSDDIINLALTIIILAVVLKVKIVVSLHEIFNNLNTIQNDSFNDTLLQITSIVIIFSFTVGIATILLREKQIINEEIKKFLNIIKSKKHSMSKLITGDLNYIETDTNKMAMILPSNCKKKELNINNIKLDDYKKIKITYSYDNVDKWSLCLNKNKIKKCYLIDSRRLEENNKKITQIIDIPHNKKYDTVSINAYGSKDEDGKFNIYEIMLLA